MEIYVLKSAGCLLLMLAFYKVFLERSSMHRVKRVYLLAAIIIPLWLPLLTFTTYVEVGSLSDIRPIPISSPIINSTEVALPLEKVLWGIYLAGITLFGVRFTLRLRSMFHKIRRNPKQRFGNIIRVLLQQDVCPHTFLNYIFLNRKAHEQNEIPDMVLEHEIAHAKEKHSLDILILEFVRVVLWFNPLLWQLGKFIKLNHEFLADRAVVATGVSAPEYQQVILAYSSHASTPAMANSINYSSLKKRFTVMRTKSSKKSIWLRSLLFLPLTAIMLFSFTSQKEVYLERSDLKQGPRTIIEPKHPDRADFSRWEDQETYYLTLDGNEISAAELKAYHPDDLPFYNETVTAQGRVLVSIMTNPYWQHESGIGFGAREQQSTATRAEMKEYNKLARKYNSMNKDERIVILKDLKRMEFIYRKMSDKQRNNAEPFPECVPPPPPPPPAPTIKGDQHEIPVAPKAEGTVPPPPPKPVYPNSPEGFDKLLSMGDAFYLNGNKISKSEAKRLKTKAATFKRINILRDDNGNNVVYFEN